MKNAIAYYVRLLETGKIFYKGTKDIVIVNSCSVLGLALELAVKDFYGLPLNISGRKGIDIIFTDDDGNKRFMEVKSNSSPIGNAVNRSSVMAYAFFIDVNKTLDNQYGYVMDKKIFLEIGYKLNHIKNGTSAGGKAKCIKTQTVYNYSKNEFHGAKAFKLEDEYLNVGAIPFSEFFA